MPVFNVVGDLKGGMYTTIKGSVLSKIMVTAADTTPGFLADKIAAGNGIDLLVLNGGGNEELQITVDEAELNINSIGGTPLTIVNGGTGQTTATAAFDALAPTTTQGDTIYYDGVDNVRLAKNTSATRYLSNTGTSNNPAWAQVNLANGVTGQLPESSLTTYNADANYYRKVNTTTFEIWYTSAVNLIANTTSTRNRDFLSYVPFIVPKSITLDRMAVEVTGAGTAASVMRIGIYNSSNNLPTSLVVDAGTINCASATFQSLTINTPLTPGLYFLAYNHNSVAAPTFRVFGTGALPLILGFPSTGGNTPNAYFGVAETYTGGYVLPNTATTPTTMVTATPVVIWVRLSA